jgi:predicted esterase
MKNLSKRSIFRIIWFSLVAIFLTWNWSTFQSRNLPDGTLETSSGINVINGDDEIIFTPAHSPKQIEVIFFQGGLTDPKAYGPLCRKLAEGGFTVHLIKMSFRLAQHDYKKISTMFDLSSGRYVIGGHSQGGKMAAQFVYENPQLMAGLFLMGTSHPRDIDLSARKIPTMKFYAENDGLASVSEVLENKNKLPTNTELILITGGNHSQFGYLGQLLGDDDAAISLEEQQDVVTENLLRFLDGLVDGR